MLMDQHWCETGSYPACSHRALLWKHLAVTWHPIFLASQTQFYLASAHMNKRPARQSKVPYGNIK